MSWSARTKGDLAIEVWEKLDCESVGAAEIEAIEEAVRGHFGESAVDAPMRIARLLADEGAELRHAEIMALHVARISHRPYEAALRAVSDISDLAGARRSIKALENLRQNYLRKNDREGLRLVRETAIDAKNTARETASRKLVDPAVRLINEEIVQWLTIWLETPESFETWLALRQKSPDFRAKFESDQTA